MGFIEHLQKEWNLINQAPLTFIVTLLLALLTGWGFMRWLHEDRFASLAEQISTVKSSNDLLNSRLQAKDDQLNDYRTRLLALEPRPSEKPNSHSYVEQKREALSQSATRFSKATNKELRDMGIKLATQIRQLLYSERQKLDQIHAGQNPMSVAVLISEMEFEYEQKYQADAIVLKDEIMSRLPLVQRSTSEDHMYRYPTNLYGLDDVATDLERLAKSLPI